MKTSLIGQEESLEILQKIIHDPPHLFFSGPYGSGKTTLITEFLQAYYAQFQMKYPSPGWILNLSSEQDRGIHCIRQSVAEFVRHTSQRPGVYRWIIIDDADSLPIISQQALRRPMETHETTTRFIFCSRHSTDLIQPIRSRCLHIELDVISPFYLLQHFSGQLGLMLKFDPDAIVFLMQLVRTPTEIYNYLRILSRDEELVGRPVTKADLMARFTAPSFHLCFLLLQAYIKGDQTTVQRLFFQIWSTGISYEDFLYELSNSVKQIGILTPETSQKIHQLIMKGWICYAQGKTHVLDLMRLFLLKTE
jgi:DNA polymerase III gamma/tau subunit